MDGETSAIGTAGSETTAGVGGEAAASGSVTGGTTTADDVAAVRAALLAAYPRAVPELVGGATVGEVLASLPAAQAAWERVAAAAAGTTAAVAVTAAAGTAPAAAPVVPAGAGLGVAIDPDRLPSTEKIRRGLAART